MQNEKRKQGEIEAVNDTEMVRFIKYLHRHSSLVSLLKWGFIIKPGSYSGFVKWFFSIAISSLVGGY